MNLRSDALQLRALSNREPRQHALHRCIHRTLCPGLCQREASGTQSGYTETATRCGQAGTRAATAAAARTAPRNERGRRQDSVDTWLKAQNDGDFHTYQTLYAQAFQGIKRVGKRTEPFDRVG